MNPEVNFRCKNGSIILLKHHSYPWSGKRANTMVLFGGEVITRKDFYAHIHDQIPAVLPYLFNGYGYSLKQLVLPWVWEVFSKGNCAMAGKCFRHMIINKYFPFAPRHMPSDASGTRHYYYMGPESTVFDLEPSSPFILGES